MDDSAAPATVPAVSAAQEMAPKASTPVVNTSVQFTSLHSSWSQPTLPCAVSPSSVAEPVRASESASRSVTETDSPSKAEALICMLYRSSVPDQSVRVFLERDGGAHQCELIMSNDEALVQTKSLSTQLSLTTNQRNPGCLGTRATWSATRASRICRTVG